jgi:iron complex outermembrane receptor protein
MTIRLKDSAGQKRGFQRGVRAVLSVSGALACAALCGQATSAQDIVLDPVVIHGGAGPAAGSGASYVSTSTTTGSKTSVPLAEIPQSVSVITRKELDDRQPAQLEDALAYTAGVVPSPWGIDDRFDECLIRGFDLCTSTLYRDGLSQRLIGFSGFKIEPYGMESIEVLKGPASVLYGENDVGGLVNATTKRPPDTPLYSGYVGYGSFDTFEAGLDVGGPVDDAGVWSYRFTGLFRDGSTQMDYTRNDRVYIAPALTWQPDAQTSLTVLANYQWDRLAPIYSVPVPGMSGYEGPEVSRNFFTGQPGFDRFDADHGSIGYQFQHEFDDNWTVRQNLRYARQTTDYAQLYFGNADGGDPVLPDGHTIARTAYMIDETASIFNVDNQVEHDETVGVLENKLLLGLDYNRWNVDGQSRYGAGPDLDILDPDRTAAFDEPELYEDYEQTVDQIGLYAQNQAKIADRFLLSFGGRQAWVDNRNDDRIGESVTRQRDNSFVGQAGIGYLFDKGIMPYASYAESFTVNLGQTRTGENFVPSEGKQYEIGVKYEPDFFSGYFTAALFDLRKTNVLTTDPEDSNFSVQTGEVRHRGLELEAKAELDFGLSLTAAYTYLDAEITKDNDGYVGNRPSLVPQNTASIWANYAFGENSALAGLSFGAGVRYVGSTFGDNENTLLVPSYTLADAALRYRHGSWQAALNVSNVFDKKYFATCYTGEGCYFGERRNIKGSLSVKF